MELKMVFSLTKDEITTLSRLTAELKSASEEINSIVIDYNESVQSLRSSVEEAVTKYNGILAEARALHHDIVSQATDDFDNKSEKWQESDTGQSVQSWIDDWENVDLGDVDFQWPDELEIDLPDHATDLEGLPAEADG